MHRSLQRDHRRGAHRSDDARPRQPPAAARHLLGAERLRRLAGGGEAHARRRRLQPLQARPHGADGQRGRRAAEVEHPAPRAHRLREDAARADARADPQRPVRDRRRDRADRGRLRRRGRREHPPEADPGGRLRHQEGGDRDHLHRRGRQDRAQGGQPVDHARRLGRGRPAGAPQDPRGHGRLGAAAGWPQAPAPGVPDDRHDERPLHLRRRVRRARQDHRAADGTQRGRLRRRGALEGLGGGVRPALARDAGRPHELRADPRVHRPAAGRLGRAPAAARRPRPDPHRAEERARPPVPALLRLRLDRARLHRRRALGDRRPRARARDRRPRPPVDHRGRPARRDVRAALAPRRLEVRDHARDDREGPQPDARHARRPRRARRRSRSGTTGVGLPRPVSG